MHWNKNSSKNIFPFTTYKVFVLHKNFSSKCFFTDKIYYLIIIYPLLHAAPTKKNTFPQACHPRVYLPVERVANSSLLRLVLLKRCRRRGCGRQQVLEMLSKLGGDYSCGQTLLRLGKSFHLFSMGVAGAANTSKTRGSKEDSVGNIVILC